MTVIQEVVFIFCDEFTSVISHYFKESVISFAMLACDV